MREPVSTDDETKAAARFVFEQGVLKRVSRTGWWHVGVKDPETIAEHAYRTAVIGIVLAGMEGADPATVSMMCVLHDTQETRVGDVPHVSRDYVTTAGNSDVTRDQVAGMPAAAAEAIQSTVDAYEAKDSLEALVARDADKLDCLVQALEYREAGYTAVGPWIDSSLAKLTTPSGKALAEAAMSMSPQEWWKAHMDRRAR